MKKNKKKLRPGWTNHVCVITLCTLCLHQSVFIPVATAKSVAALSEAGDEVTEQAIGELDIEQLREELAQARRQLGEVSRLYAESHLANQQLLEELAVLRLQAVNLMGEHRDRSAAYRQAVAIEALIEVQDQHQDLYREIREFGDYLQTVLAVIEPSPIVQREIEERYASLNDAVFRLEKMPSIVAWRGGDPIPGRNRARIMRVDETLQVVILGAGENDFVRPGSVWQVTDDHGDSVARIRVVETRAAISAAIPVAGNPHRLVPGLMAELVPSVKQD